MKFSPHLVLHSEGPWLPCLYYNNNSLPCWVLAVCQKLFSVFLHVNPLTPICTRTAEILPLTLPSIVQMTTSRHREVQARAPVPTARASPPYFIKWGSFSQSEGFVLDYLCFSIVFFFKLELGAWVRVHLWGLPASRHFHDGNSSLAQRT